MREPKAKFLFLTTSHPWSQQSQRFVHSSHSLAGSSEDFVLCSYDQSSHLARRVTYPAASLLFGTQPATQI